VVECSSIIFIWPKSTRNYTLLAIILLHIGIDGAMNMHCFEWLAIVGWLFFLVERRKEETSPLSSETLTTNEFTLNNATNLSTQKSKLTISANAERIQRIQRGFLNLFLFTLSTSLVFDAIPFQHFASMIPDAGAPSSILQSVLIHIDDFRTNVAQPYYYIPYLHPIGLYQGVWDLFTGTNNHNYHLETVITYHNSSSASHWSPDWGTMTWYEKKRWQRPMTFYENFIEAACKDCYATYYAKANGPNVASVRILSHCEYPPIEPPGNLLDMDYFFKTAKETLVSREPEEIFTLNYCDDTSEVCEVFMEKGYCNSLDDAVLYLMVTNCKHSCQLCHDYDLDALDVGTRISVYYTVDKQYFDGTIANSQMIHHIRRYLVKYDGYDSTPEWITSMSLREQGVQILHHNDSHVSNQGETTDEQDGIVLDVGSDDDDQAIAAYFYDNNSESITIDRNDADGELDDEDVVATSDEL
jgi:hypothetical protein